MEEKMFIKGKKLLSAPELKEKYNASVQIKKNVDDNLSQLKDIITGQSDKFLVVIGPCSVTDEKSICEYALKLLNVYERLQSKIFIVLRAFTVKSRSNLNSYKGFVHRPNLTEGENIFDGIILARKLMLKLIDLTGLAIANEFIYPELFDYTDDLISYYTLGARTCNSQLHKLFLSGTDIPVGIKNSFSGNLTQNVLDIQTPHEFILKGYQTKTLGNILAHGILRGTTIAPNYHYENLIEQIENSSPLKNKFIMVDTNHANSNKNSSEQPRIAKEILFNRQQNSLIKKYVRGLMIESFLEDGRQNENGTVFGKSITDPCLGFYETEKLLYHIAQNL